MFHDRFSNTIARNQNEICPIRQLPIRHDSLVHAPIRPLTDSWRSQKTEIVEWGQLGTNAMKRVAAGAYLLTPWLFEPAKRPDDRADYCPDCSFLPQWKHRILVFTLEWSGVRPMGEQWWGLGPMSISSEVGHLAMPINFLAYGKNHMAMETRWKNHVIPKPGTSRPRVLCSAVAAWLGGRV